MYTGCTCDVHGVYRGWVSPFPMQMPCQINDIFWCLRKSPPMGGTRAKSRRARTEGGRPLPGVPPLPLYTAHKFTHFFPNISPSSPNVTTYRGREIEGCCYRGTVEAVEVLGGIERTGARGEGWCFLWPVIRSVYAPPPPSSV